MRKVILLTAVFGVWNLSAAQTAIPIPSADQIIAKVRKEHPRIMATKEDFARVKKLLASEPKLREWHSEILKRADSMLSEPPSKYEIPDGLRLLSVSRRVLQRVQTLGLVYHTTGEAKYAERVWREVEAAANFQDWNPRHFLDTAEMTHAFALAYDWLYAYWSDAQKETIRSAIVEKGLRPAETVYNGTGTYSKWHKARHNWNQVCNGGIGIGALALADELPDLCGSILENAAKTIQLAMHEFAPDGAWAEGPGYWNYATTYNVAFLAALESALGTDFGLSQIDGFRYAGHFPIYLTGPLRRTFNYADGSDGAIRAPHMFWLARKFNEPNYALYQAHFASPHPLDLLWVQPVKSDTMDLPLSRYFRNAEVATFRSSWDDSDAVFVGFKAGDNKANHSNLDLGTFVLDANGVRWAVDLGADNYNLPGYFGKNRWNYYRMRAEGHNTLVINPGVEPDQNPSAAPRITKFESSSAETIAIADLTAAYAHAASEVKRGLSFSADRVLVQDEVQAREPAEVWWFMHTPAEIRLDD
ncbi:MAG: heparinase II/III domain-containing protein, partial [Limisphaerales bacterium]